MDKRLLGALENLSLALEEIAMAIDDSNKAKAKSNVGTALTSGNLDAKVELINQGVKQLLSDNKKIIKNQETLISMAKEKKDKSLFSEVGEKSNSQKIKDGLGIILTIAVGILAIGLAFKLIGGINFVTVIGLSIALPILAIAYGIIAKQDPSKSNAVITISRTMAFAILAAGFFLSFVTPITFAKLMTTILIAGALVVLSYSLAKIQEALTTMKSSSLLKLGYLVLVFTSLSLAIALSSEILNLVVPVSFMKLFTAILIAAAFVALSYGLKNIVGALDGVGFKQMATIFILPIILLALSFSIAISSQILNKVVPISFPKLFTAVLIAAVFVGLSYGLKNIVGALGSVNLSKIPIMTWVIPLLFLAMSVAIASSSPFLAKTVVVGFFVLLSAALISLIFVPLAYAAYLIAPRVAKLKPDQLWKIPVTMVAMATAVMLVSWIFMMAAPVSFVKTIQLGFLALIMVGIAFILDKLYSTSFGKLNPKTAIKNGLVLVIMAATIAAVSIALSFGNYENYPGIWWTISVAIALTIFGLAVVVIGFAVNIIGQKTLITGAAAMVILSVAIALTSNILGLGNYDSYPGIFWTIGVGITLVAFSLLALALGAVFGGPLAVVGLAGLAVMGILSLGIVAVSLILSLGRYDDDAYPSFIWNVGVISSLLAFGAAAVALGIISPLIGTLGLLGIGVMLGLAATISAVSLILATGQYDNPGMWEWAKSTVLLYLAFTPLLVLMGALSLVSGLTTLITFGTVDPLKRANDMILGIADLIVGVAERLSEGNYAGGPTKTWAEGIALAISAFSEVYGMLARSKKWFFSGPTMKEYKDAIETIADGIMVASEKLSSFSLKPYPSKAWAEGVGGAIKAFAPVFEMLQESKGWFGLGGPTIEEYKNAIVTICEGISVAADKLSTFSEKPYPSPGWSQGVGGAIKAFSPVYEILAKSNFWTGGPTIEQYNMAIKTILKGILYAAKFFEKNIGSFNMENVPPTAWSFGVGGAIKAFVPVLDFVSKNTGIFSSGVDILRDTLRVTANSIAYVAKVFSKIKFPKEFNVNGYQQMSFAIKDWVTIVAKLIGPNLSNLKKGLKWTDDIVSNMAWASWYFLGVIKNLKTYDQVALKQMISGIKDYVILIADVIGKNKNFINKKTMNLTYDVVSAMSWLAWNFKGVSRNMESFDKGWMAAAANSIRAYVELAIWLNDKNVSYGKILSAVSNMEILAKGYGRFADGLKKINQEVEKIDVQKLTALKSFTGSIVLMSLMDPVQFNKMMDALEKKASIFVDVINELETKADKSARPGAAKTTGVKTGGEKGAQRTTSDLFAIMTAIDAKMATLVNYNSQFSSYINEIRNNDLCIKGPGASDSF